MSKRSAFMFAAFVFIALGAPLGAARAQTSPDFPTGGSKDPTSGGAFRPVSGVSLSGSFGSIVSFARFEAVTTPWLGRLVSGRGRLSPSMAWDRRRVLR